MNPLSEKFLNLSDGETVVLEKDKIYDVYQDDSFELTGYYCSNTAKRHENPDGLRRTAVYLKNKKNVTLDGNGATVLVHGKMTPLLFDECENICVKNLTVDYACPTMAEFTVTESKGREITLKINDDCLFRLENGELIWQGETDKNGVPYWEDSYIGNRRHIKIFDPVTKQSSDFRREDFRFRSIENLGGNRLRAVFANKKASLPEGAVVQTRNIVRDQTGSLFQRCKNLCFENLRIKFMHGLGMVSQFCENVTYKNCDLTPANGRTITSTADFFQFSGCRGKIRIENCRAWGAQDDYVNVHGTHLQIVEADNRANCITVRFMHDESWGFQAFEKGDELDFIRWDTLIPYSHTAVTDYEKLNDTDIRLYLDRPLPEGIVLCRDVVENASWTPDLYVANCDFGPTSGRGILCTTRGGVIIENNSFFKVRGPALLVEDDCNFWFESGYINEIIFRNNKVTACEYDGLWEGAPVIRCTPKVMKEDSQEFVHGRIVVTGNAFSQPREENHVFCLEYLGEAEICNNVFDAPLRINRKCVGRITQENNFWEVL